MSNTDDTNIRWLIRTESKHILGPINHTKLLELLEGDSLGDSDELCSGNGYWFSITEESLMQKYVFQKEHQGFNEVSEALNEFRKREKISRQKNMVEEADTKVVALADLHEISAPSFADEKESANSEVIENQTIISSKPVSKEAVEGVEEESEKARSYKDVKVKRVANQAVKRGLSQIVIVRLVLLAFLMSLILFVVYSAKIFSFLDSTAQAQESSQLREEPYFSNLNLGDFSLRLSANILGGRFLVNKNKVGVKLLDCSSYLEEEIGIIQKFSSKSQGFLDTCSKEKKKISYLNLI